MLWGGAAVSVGAMVALSRDGLSAAVLVGLGSLLAWLQRARVHGASPRSAVTVVALAGPVTLIARLGSDPTQPWWVSSTVALLAATALVVLSGRLVANTSRVGAPRHRQGGLHPDPSRTLRALVLLVSLLIVLALPDGA